MFSGLADAGEGNTPGTLVYAAKRNRNLRVIADNDRFFEFTKSGFEFRKDAPDQKLSELLKPEPEFIIDDASVILKHNGIRLRLPKGNAAFDKPFASGWPRTTREVESERHLANIHAHFMKSHSLRMERLLHFI